jgi:hypothetical protein
VGILTDSSLPQDVVLKNLAVKDVVFFLTWRAGAAYAAGHQQRGADRDQDRRPVSLELEKPTCEGMKMERMHVNAPPFLKPEVRGMVFRKAKYFLPDSCRFPERHVHFSEVPMAQSLTFD